MVIKEYKAGETLEGDFAIKMGSDVKVAEAYGIKAFLHDMDRYWQCPEVFSDTPGSGKFPAFLEELKEVLNKPLVFACVVNEGILKHLANADIPVKDFNGQIYYVKMEVEA